MKALEERLQKVEDELDRRRTTTAYLEEKLNALLPLSEQAQRLPRRRRSSRRPATAPARAADDRHATSPSTRVRARVVGVHGRSAVDDGELARRRRGYRRVARDRVRSDQLARQADVPRQRAQPAAVLGHRRDRAAQRERRLRAARARRLRPERAVRSATSSTSSSRTASGGPVEDRRVRRSRCRPASSTRCSATSTARSSRPIASASRRR